MPKLTVGNEWQRLPFTTGTIDNCSVRSIEISDDDADDDSIILYPRQKYPFKGRALKVRCGSGNATISLTDFTSGLGTFGGTTGNTDNDAATRADIDAMF